MTWLAEFVGCLKRTLRTSQQNSNGWICYSLKGLLKLMNYSILILLSTHACLKNKLIASYINDNCYNNGPDSSEKRDSSYRSEQYRNHISEAQLQNKNELSDVIHNTLAGFDRRLRLDIILIVDPPRLRSSNTGFIKLRQKNGILIIAQSSIGIKFLKYHSSRINSAILFIIHSSASIVD